MLYVIALPFFSCALLVTSCCCLNHLSADDETSNVLKRSINNMFAHVLALCFLLRLLKRSNHYVPGRILFKRQADKRARSISCFPVADLENFGGGDFKHKTSKIRMSSPKLRVIFRPKSEIQTFFPPKIRWSPKKKGLHQN